MPTTKTRSTPVSSPTKPSSGISRIDQPSRRTHGYFVRVGYKRTTSGYRPSHTAFFGDASHGSKREAWEAAEAWLKKARRSLKSGKPASKAAKKKSATRKPATRKSATKKSATKKKTSMRRN